jgi:hypothetical protein
MRATDARTPWQARIVAEMLRGVKIIKVKQPWADALVTGEKNIENRTWKLDSSSNGYFLVASSARSSFTESLLQQYVTRRANANLPAHDPPKTKDDFVFSSIVGLVHVQGCFSQAEMAERGLESSPWYTRDVYAWVIDEAVKFDEPIALLPDDKMQTQVKLENRAGYGARVREEIRKKI